MLHAMDNEWLSPDFRSGLPAGKGRKYLVFDGLFREDKLAYLDAIIDKLDMVEDYPDLNYDARACRIDADLDAHGLSFFGSAAWHLWLASLAGVDLCNPGQTVLRARVHPPGARGFWIHTDRDSNRPKRIAALLYLNRHWVPSDGGVLQIWRTSPLPAKTRYFTRYLDYVGKPLDFLEASDDIAIEVGAVQGLEPVRAQLEASISPIRNRLVILNFVEDPCYHSVTPSRNCRKGLVQWLY